MTVVPGERRNPPAGRLPEAAGRPVAPEALIDQATLSMWPAAALAAWEITLAEGGPLYPLTETAENSGPLAMKVTSSSIDDRPPPDPSLNLIVNTPDKSPNPGDGPTLTLTWGADVEVVEDPVPVDGGDAAYSLKIV